MAKKTAHDLVRTGWLSNQHGAWAMMIVPLFVGSYLGGFSWTQLLLTAAWFTAFFSFNALGLWMKLAAVARKRDNPTVRKNIARRQRVYLPAMLTYATIAAAGALILIILHPKLLMWAPAFAVLAGTAIWEMWRDRERSYLARASAILASGLLAPIAFQLGTDPVAWNKMWVAAVVAALYFLGTIPLVKTLIRERGDTKWLAFSFSYHAVVLVIATVLAALGLVTWWIPGLWLILLARAIAFPIISRQRGPLKPAVIGFSEVFFSVLVVLAVLA